MRVPRTEKQDHVPPRPLAEQIERPRLLLVEDDDAVRRSLQLLLVSQGYDVRAYRNGNGLAADPEAIRSLCLISDLVLADSDGLVLIQELRAAGWSGPAILISGHLSDEWASRARHLGYDVVLSKPIGDSVLVNAVSRLIDRAVRKEDGSAMDGYPIL